MEIDPAYEKTEKEWGEYGGKDSEKKAFKSCGGTLYPAWIRRNDGTGGGFTGWALWPILPARSLPVNLFIWP